MKSSIRGSSVAQRGEFEYSPATKPRMQSNDKNLYYNQQEPISNISPFFKMLKTSFWHRTN